MAEASVFCASAIAPQARLAAWRESIGVIFDVRLDAVRSPERFRARVESVLLDGLVLNRCRTSRQSFSRPVSRYAADGLDHYMFQLFLSGSSDIPGRGQRVQAGGRALVCLDLADRVETFADDFEMLNVIVPRRRLSGLLYHPDSLQGLTMDTGTGAGHLLANYMVSLFAVAPTLSVIEETVAAGVLIQLIASAYNGVPLSSADPPGWTDHALVLQARRIMREQLADPTLGPDLIAARMGISRARLYRAFSEIGGVNEAIRELRLRRCFADLVSPALAGLSISEIAYRWGFADPSHFARAFRTRFSMTPSEARHRKLESLARPPGANGLDRSYEAWIEALA